MRNYHVMAAAAILALGLTAGCQRTDDAAAAPDNTADAATGAPTAGGTAADASLLTGPVPRCPELTSPARRDYRIAALRVCEQATTLDARLKNPGCLAKQQMVKCMGNEESRHYSVEAFEADERAALQ